MVIRCIVSRGQQMLQGAMCLLRSSQETQRLSRDTREDENSAEAAIMSILQGANRVQATASTEKVPQELRSTRLGTQ